MFYPRPEKIIPAKIRLSIDGIPHASVSNAAQVIEYDRDLSNEWDDIFDFAVRLSAVS